jgi:hypothetical protein
MSLMCFVHKSDTYFAISKIDLNDTSGYQMTIEYIVKPLLLPQTTIQANNTAITFNFQHHI